MSGISARSIGRQTPSGALPGQSRCSNAPFGDLQVRVLSRRGPVTWDAVVQQSDRLENDDPVVLLAHGGHHNVEEGTVLRILDARVVTNTPDELGRTARTSPIASLTSASEVYVLPLEMRVLPAS